MIALDFDGVVANYNDHTTTIRINTGLLALLPRQRQPIARETLPDACRHPREAGEFLDLHNLKEIEDMKAFPYTNTKGNTYYLHARVTTLKNGQQQTIYFFAKEVKEGALEEVPAGYVATESKNGLPVLKKKA